MSSSEKKTCPVCADHFTAVIRQPITCPYCPFEACRKCSSQYLLSTLNDSHCMQCKREWNREFIDLRLTQTFRRGPLKQHRRRVLMDRERGRLPAMQVYVEAQVDYTEAMRVWNTCRARRVELKKERNRIQATYGGTDTLEQLTDRIRPLNNERRELKTRMAAAETKMAAANLILTGKTKEVRQFIMKCPSDGCRGFLSSAWKCGTCQKFFCSDCHVEKEGQRDDAHVCNEELKATAAMIRQETKPCPKCGIRISKIDGCDQMWCVSCQTTFSWNSGQILLNTVVHNPHYYEYLRRVNNGAVPREAGDVPCGGLPNAYLFTRIVMDIPGLSQAERNNLLDSVRCLSDIQWVRLPQFPLRQAANVNRDIDIRYLMKEITEEEWGTALERVETTAERKKEIGLILQTLLHVGSEKLTQLQNTHPTQRTAALAKTLLHELEEVRKYSNKSLVEKGIQMGMVVPQISTDWRWSWARKNEMRQLASGEPATAQAPPAEADAVTVPDDPEPYNEAGVNERNPDETVWLEYLGEIVPMTWRAATILNLI